MAFTAQWQPVGPTIMQGYSRLGQGIGQGVGGIISGIARELDLNKQAKASDALLKATPELRKEIESQYGSWETFQNLGARERLGVNQNLQAALKLKELIGQGRLAQQDADLRKQEFGLKQQEFQAGQDEAGALKRFAEAYAQGPDNRIPDMGPMFDPSAPPGAQPDASKLVNYAPATEVERRNYALQLHPEAFAARQFDNSTSALARLGGEGNEPLAVHEGRSAAGTRYATFGKGFSWDPRDVNEAREQATARLIDKRAEANETKNLLPPGTKLRIDEAGAIVATTPEGFIKVVGRADDLAVLLNRNREEAPKDANKSGPTEEDVKWLKAHPELRDKFDLQFGAGSAARYLDK